MKKRILHCHTSGVMAALFVMPLMEYEHNQGYQSKIITSIHPLKGFDSSVIPFDLSVRNLFSLPYAFIRLCLYLSKFRPNILICHNFKSSALPLLAGRLMGIKTRIYFNHGVPFIAYTGIKQKFLKFIEALNLSLATEVITVSPDMRRALMQVKKSKKVSLISNGSACGIDLALFSQNHGSHSDFLLEYGLSEKDCIVTYIGRPEVRKGFLVALAVWEKHFQDKEAYKLLMCGPTNQDVINAFGRIPKNVYCLGFVKNIPKILFFSEYLILPSFHEGLSYAVLEAMASKTIVIANDVQGIRCLVEDGANGFLVQDNDVDQFAQELILLSQQPASFTNRIKEAGLKTANLYSRARFLEVYGAHLRQFD